MPCNVSKEQLWSWIDLNDSELDAHLAQCPQCRERASEYRKQIEALQSSDDTATLDVPLGGHPSSKPSSKSKESYAPPSEYIGPYHIGHEIGRGGMGVVYFGMLEDGEIRQRAAIKVLKRGTDTEDTLRRFERERQLLAALNHPNIARLYQTGKTEDNLPYYSMEYIEGLPIDEYCDKNKLDINARLQLFLKVCAAVSYAHQNLVVHRDLKPDNILVTSTGIPKLLDFGIAKMLNPDMVGGGLPTMPGHLMMTPEYAAPEQVLGEQITTACDVYSLGVILFELLTGHRPYRLKKRIRQEIERVLVQVIPPKPSKAIDDTEEVPLRPSERAKSGTTTRTVSPDSVSVSRGLRIERLRRKLAGDLDNIVLMTLRKAPTDRYPQVDRLIDDVQRHLDGLPVLARPQSWSYRSSKFLHRHKAASVIAALIILSIFLGAWSVVSNLQLSAAQNEAVANETRARQRENQFDQLNTFLLNDLYEVVAKLPDSPQINELIMNQAIKIIEKLETGEVFTTEDTLSLAQAYAKLSEVQSGVRNPELGLKESAVKNLDRAEELCDQVLATREGDVEASRIRVSILRHRGDLAYKSEQYGETFTYCKAALDIADELFNADPTSLFNRRLYANTLLDVGGAFYKLGDDTKAEEYYRNSLAVRKQTLVSHPLDTGVRRDYSVGLNRLGGIEARKDRYEEALEHYLESLQYRQELLKENPSNNREARDVAGQHRLLASVYNKLDSTTEFLFHYQEYVDLTADLAAMSPQDARAQADMRTARNAIAAIYRATNDSEKTLYDFWLYEQLIRRQLERTPESEAFQQALVHNFLQLTEVQIDIGDTKAALTTLQEAKSLCKHFDNAELSELCKEIDEQINVLAP